MLQELRVVPGVPCTTDENTAPIGLQVEPLRCLLPLVTGPNRLFHRWPQDSCYFFSLDQRQVFPRNLSLHVNHKEIKYHFFLIWNVHRKGSCTPLAPNF